MNCPTTQIYKVDIERSNVYTLIIGDDLSEEYYYIDDFTNSSDVYIGTNYCNYLMTKSCGLIDINNYFGMTSKEDLLYKTIPLTISKDKDLIVDTVNRNLRFNGGRNISHDSIYGKAVEFCILHLKNYLLTLI